jgi:hypothetical protein
MGIDIVDAGAADGSQALAALAACSGLSPESVAALDASEHTPNSTVAHKRHGCELSPGSTVRVDRCVCLSVKPRCFNGMCW